jgi:hypothetical protein
MRGLQSRAERRELAEEWRAIPGHDGYEVSDLGRVRSIDRHVTCPPGKLGVQRRFYRGKVLKLSPSGNGYLHVTLGKKNHEGVDVHQLVLLAFVGPPPDGHEGDHRNRNRHNNELTNLRYRLSHDNRSDGARRR